MPKSSDVDSRHWHASDPRQPASFCRIYATDNMTLLIPDLPAAHAWIHTVLAQHGMRPAGDITQQRVSPWSEVLRVPTAQGDAYFKASAPALACEPALTAYLARLHPDLLPELLATDNARGWLLMRDSGTPLRARLKADKSLARWREILPVYAGFQRSLMPYAAELLALGVPDRRLDKLPAQFAALLDDEAALSIDQPGGLTAAGLTRLRAGLASFAALCARLDRLGIPPTLHHDDFHDGNLYLRDGGVRFADWGECAVTHPFFPLVVLVRGAANVHQVAEDGPELAQVRDWYLEPWTDYAPLAGLRQAAELSQRIGLINRALTWQRVTAELPAALKAEYADAVPSYLNDYLATVQ